MQRTVSNVVIKAANPHAWYWARDEHALFIDRPSQIVVKFTDRPERYRHTLNETEEEALHSWYLRTATAPPQASVVLLEEIPQNR